MEKPIMNKPTFCRHHHGSITVCRRASLNYLDKSGSFLKRKAALKQYNFALKIDRTATDRMAANKGFSAQLSQLKLIGI